MEYELIQKMAFHIIGGLGIFLIGMRYMSDGMQSVAGPSLKRLIASVTSNRFLACTVGVLVTLIVQSSSITTVMTVGLVNSGIMGLSQSIGVIMGANIGTTITGWILVLKVGKWGLPILGVSAFFFLFSKKEFVKFIALAFLGIGMIFFGLEVMKGGVKFIKDLPDFESAFAYFTADSYAGVLKCALVGCLLTFLVQSSSATLGITIALAYTKVIPFETAAALVLGENIGTTITAYLASLGASITAKKAAYFHILFNVIGVIWVTALFRWYLPFIEQLISILFNISDVSEMVLNADGEKTYPYTTTGIAAVHTVFNITNTVIFLPFVHYFSGFLTKFVKDKKKGASSDQLTHLNVKLYDSPFAALRIAEHEVAKMVELNHVMMNELKGVIEDHQDKEKFTKSIFEKEDQLDTYQKDITTFVSEILSDAISLQDVDTAKNQLRVADEYESLSDYIAQVLKLLLRLKDHDLLLSSAQKDELLGLHQQVMHFFEHVQLLGSRAITFEKITEENTNITAQFKDLRNAHWDRIKEEGMEPLLNTSFTDMLHSYRKMKDHLLNIAETQDGLK